MSFTREQQIIINHIAHTNEERIFKKARQVLAASTTVLAIYLGNFCIHQDVPTTFINTATTIETVSAPHINAAVMTETSPITVVAETPAIRKVPAPSIKPSRYSDEEVKVLAMTLYGEARGEGEDGMIAVAHVIKNRTMAGGINGWPEDVIGVIMHPHAFSVWKKTDKGHANMIAAFTNGCDGSKGLAKDACDIAEDVLNGQSQSPFGGQFAVYYHATNHKWKFASAYVSIGDYGNHRFYLDDRTS